ncbi:MAG TPA: aminodeoxychorismate synthase component I [Vicinamibacterales bacterium]|nr:aminodeoxychorismate synthase component I [Vicinamibacterales bacterium]
MEAQTPADVPAAIADVERLTRDHGYYAAGYLAYEAGAAFGLGSGRMGAMPLAWFALFEQASAREADAIPASESYRLGEARPSLDRPQFAAAFGRIKSHLAAGDSYQVNFTFKMRATFEGDPLGLFADLVRAQEGSYSVYLNTGNHAICSASPELFLKLDGLDVVARPMKGTAPRGRTLAEDEERREALRQSPKERAENVMIVDMVRNDLGKIAEVGTVETPELFSVERYPNVWQMTSLVRARSRASLGEMFAAVHPSASVTGAPKHRTMEIIDALETEPRGVYTGAIGYLRPDGNGHFNVAIRTAVVDPDQGLAEFGVGSGVVWDSEAAAEYDECLLKGSVLGRSPADFELLETTVWTAAGSFLHLERHLERQRASAEYFGFAYDEAAVRAALQEAVANVTGRQRVRFLTSREGAVRVETFPIAEDAPRAPLRVALAAGPVDSRDPFLFHKTTNRSVYERAAIDGMDDVILWNEKGEITESTRANVIVELENGDVVTPPIDAGLLGGTARAEICASGDVREKSVTVAELKAARRIWLTNSVYARRDATLVDSPA